MSREGTSYYKNGTYYLEPNGPKMGEHDESLFTFIMQFTTPILNAKNGEKNRWEGYITQGRPYPDFIDPDGQEGWWAVEPYDSEKIYLTLYWVDEENSITQEHQVIELTGFDGTADEATLPKLPTWPLVLLKNYDWGA